MLKHENASEAMATLPRLSRGRPVAVLPLLLLAVVAFVPSGLFSITGGSSQAAGTAVACTIIIGLLAAGILKTPRPTTFVNWLSALLLVAVVVISHAVISYLIFPIEVGRTFASLGILMLMVLAAFAIAFNVFEGSKGEHLEWATKIILAIFFVAGILGVLGVQPPTGGGLERPVFPFAEPSHYALALTPFLLNRCAASNDAQRMALLGLSLGIAYLLQSLSMVVGTALCALICLPAVRALFALAAGSIAIKYLQLDYFTERLDLSQQNENLSALVFRQGWELMADSISRSHGWGIGFQQLGFAPVNSPTANMIYRILGSDSNIKDGGFTAAKFISEFGLLGIALIILYLTFVLRLALRLRRSVGGHLHLKPAESLAASLIVGYSVEAFVRGVGYFSGSSVLVLAAIVYLYGRSRQQRQVIPHE